MLEEDLISEKLKSMFKKSPSRRITNESRIVVFSDLHIGDGRAMDDFHQNSDLFIAALEKYYLKEGYTLILNGDVEELHRYLLPKIRERWSHLYSLFNQFHREGRLFKLVGNHDSKLLTILDGSKGYPLYETLRLEYRDNSIFIFHGHQASPIYERFNEVAGFFLRHVAKPLGIKHYSVAHNKKKKFKIERQTFDFSRKNGLVSLIGHTHRPLFESLSKSDILNFRIEKLLRIYRNADPEKQENIIKTVKHYKKEIERHMGLDKKKRETYLNMLYSSHTIIPCLFNSGCVIGKRGMTCLEISEGNISLVHWYERENEHRHRHGKKPVNLIGTPYLQKTLKKDSLDYIFTRIKLLV